MMKPTVAVNHTVIKNVFSEQYINDKLLPQIESGARYPLNLVDGDDRANEWYKSTRSNLEYRYATEVNDDHVINLLSNLTGKDFKNSINKLALPVFKYGEGGFIKAHRGVQKEHSTTQYQEYVAVMMLSNPGVDFQKGKFYLNYYAEASPDGKTVYNDNKEDRVYPEFNKGDLIIFHNPTTVHGVEEVKGKGAVRMTCSWRTND